MLCLIMMLYTQSYQIICVKSLTKVCTQWCDVMDLQFSIINPVFIFKTDSTKIMVTLKNFDSFVLPCC